MQSIEDNELTQIEGGMTLACGLSIAGVAFATVSLVVAFGGLATVSGGVSAGALALLGINYGGYVTAAFALAISC